LMAGLKVTIMSGIIQAIIILMFSQQLANIIIRDNDAARIVELLAVTACLTVVTSPLSAYVCGLQKFRTTTLISVLGFILLRASFVVALFLGTGLYGLSFAWMVTSIISSLGIAILVLRMAGKGEAYPISQLLAYSMPLFMSTLLGFLWQWIDSPLLPYIGDMNLLVMTNIAMTLTNISLVLINSASTILFTHFVRVDATDGREVLFEAGRNISRLLSYCFIPLGFFVGAISGLLVLLYAGDAFIQAVILLKILSPFMTTYTVIYIIWTNEVTATGKTSLLLMNTIVMLASYLLLSILLVPKLGEVGYLLARVLYGIVVFPYIWRKTKTLIPVRVDFKALLLSVLVSTVIIVPATLVEILSSSYLLSAVTSILGCVCYILIVIKAGLLNKDEIKFLLGLITQSLNFRHILNGSNNKK